MEFVGAGLIILFLTGSGLWVFINVFEENETKKAREQLKKDIISATNYNQPSYEQLLDIADVSGADKALTYDLCREIMKDILINKDHELSQHHIVVEGYIKKHREVEPFEGMPSETRIHLERLSEVLADKDYSLEPLTMQIKKLITIYEKENKAQKMYTMWSFFLGLIAILFAGYTYFVPNNLSI